MTVLFVPKSLDSGREGPSQIRPRGGPWREGVPLVEMDPGIDPKGTTSKTLTTLPKNG